jgi:DNA-binding MarR family transcriptional regulator
MDLQNEPIVAQIFKLTNRLIIFEKKNIFQFKNVKLYPSEIHLILLIHQEQDTNATIMAEKLGVTKGAISQTLSRLEKKGMLRKIKDPYNKNELTVEFTPLGQQAIQQYLQLMASVHLRYDQYLSTLTDSEREVIKRFLAHLMTILDEIETMQ